MVDEDIAGDPDLDLEPEEDVEGPTSTDLLESIKASLDKQAGPAPVVEESAPEVIPTINPFDDEKLIAAGFPVLDITDEAKADVGAAPVVIPPVIPTDLDPKTWDATTAPVEPVASQPIQPEKDQIEEELVIPQGVSLWQCYVKEVASGCPPYSVEDGQNPVCPNCGSKAAWRLS